MGMQKQKQHYVPQFYLRNFCAPNQPRKIWAWDLRQRDVGEDPVSIKSVAQIPNLYGDKDCEVERKLSTDIEHNAAPIIKDVLKKKSLSGFIPEQWKEFNLFIANLFMRTARLRPFQLILGMEKGFLEQYLLPSSTFWRTKIGCTEISRILQQLKLEEGRGKYLQTHSRYWKKLKEQSDVLAERLSYMSGKLICNETSEPFITSDYPVVFQNRIQMGLRGLGWHFPETYSGFGLQVFFPLSPKIMLILYEPKAYQVGDSSEEMVRLSEEKVIKRINALQWLWTGGHVYGSEKHLIFPPDNNEFLKRRFRDRCNKLKRNKDGVPQPFDPRSLSFDFCKQKRLTREQIEAETQKIMKNYSKEKLHKALNSPEHYSIVSKEFEDGENPETD